MLELKMKQITIDLTDVASTKFCGDKLTWYASETKSAEKDAYHLQSITKALNEKYHAVFNKGSISFDVVVVANTKKDATNYIRQALKVDAFSEQACTELSEIESSLVYSIKRCHEFLKCYSKIKSTKSPQIKIKNGNQLSIEIHTDENIIEVDDKIQETILKAFIALAQKPLGLNLVCDKQTEHVALPKHVNEESDAMEDEFIICIDAIDTKTRKVKFRYPVNTINERRYIDIPYAPHLTGVGGLIDDQAIIRAKLDYVLETNEEGKQKKSFLALLAIEEVLEKTGQFEQESLDV